MWSLWSVAGTIGAEPIPVIAVGRAETANMGRFGGFDRL